MKKISVLFVFLLSICFQSYSQEASSDIKTALLIIDIQEFYFPGEGPGLVGAEEASLAAKEVLEIFRDQEQLVIHVRHKSSKGFAIHKNVKPLDNEKIITKEEVNCFHNTDLSDYLAENSITRLIIIGMQTQMCLEAAVRAGHDNNFECIVVEDACATRDLKYGNKLIKASEVHASTLATFVGGGYSRVISLEELSENQNKYLFDLK